MQSIPNSGTRNRDRARVLYCQFHS